jgi:hypothetical protein
MRELKWSSTCVWTSTLDGDKWSDSISSHFNPVKNPLSLLAATPGCPQTRFGVKNNFFSIPWIEPRVLGHPTYNPPLCYLSMTLQPFAGPWPLFSFLILRTVGRTPWTGDQHVARPLPAHRTTQTQDKGTQTSRPRVGFEPTMPVLERAKAVHVLHRATVSSDIKLFLRIFPVICVHLRFCILFPIFMSPGRRVSVFLKAQYFRLTQPVPTKISEWWNTWEIITRAHVETGN